MLTTCTYFSVFNLTWLFISPMVSFLHFIFNLLKWPGRSAEAILTHFSSTAYIYFSICVKSKEHLSISELWSFQKHHLLSNSKSLSSICRQYIIYKVVYIYWKKEKSFFIKSNNKKNKIKDVDCIYGAVANKKPLFSTKCHTDIFYTIIFAEYNTVLQKKTHKSQKYILY